MTLIKHFADAAVFVISLLFARYSFADSSGSATINTQIMSVSHV